MKDFLKDDLGDMAIVDGDFAVGISDYQHEEDLLIAQKGDFKQFPDVGVGIEDFINESDIDGLLDAVRSEFTKDGMTVSNISFDEQTGNLNYDASY